MKLRLPAPAIGVLVAALLIGGVYTAAGSLSGLDRMRKDYLALRHLREAMAACVGESIDRATAAGEMNRALELAPDDPLVRSSAPQVFVAAGDYRRALAELMKEESGDPYLLGMCLVELGRRAEGARLLLDTLKATKSLYNAKQVSEQAYAMQLNNVGYLLADNGMMLEEAKSMLEMAVQLLPLEPNCVDSLGWVHYRLGDHRKAVFYLERAARQQPQPGEPEIFYHLGTAYAQTGRVQRAEKLLTHALRLDPEHEEAQRELRKLRWTLPTSALAHVDAIGPGRPG